MKCFKTFIVLASSKPGFMLFSFLNFVSCQQTGRAFVYPHEHFFFKILITLPFHTNQKPKLLGSIARVFCAENDWFFSTKNL